MPLTVEAIYENGVLRPTQPLPLSERARVQITVHLEPSPLLHAYGIIGWTGDPATLEHLALDPEFDPQE